MTLETGALRAAFGARPPREQQRGFRFSVGISKWRLDDGACCGRGRPLQGGSVKMRAAKAGGAIKSG
jgi:hypothetical protein